MRHPEMAHRVKRAFLCKWGVFLPYTSTHPSCMENEAHKHKSRYRIEGRSRNGERVFDVGVSLSASSSSATCHMLSLFVVRRETSVSRIPVPPPPQSSSPPLPLTLSNCLFYPLACPTPTEGWIQPLSVDCWESMWTGWESSSCICQASPMHWGQCATVPPWQNLPGTRDTSCWTGLNRLILEGLRWTENFS